MPRANAAYKVFARQFAVAVNIQWLRSVSLHIWLVFLPIEYIIGADVDDQRPKAVCHFSRISRTTGIDRKCLLGILFTLFNVVEGRGVNDYFRGNSRKYCLDRLRRLHIHSGMGQRMHGITVALKFLADISANLPLCSDDSDRLHFDLDLRP